MVVGWWLTLGWIGIFLTLFCCFSFNFLRLLAFPSPHSIKHSAFWPVVRFGWRAIALSLTLSATSHQLFPQPRPPGLQRLHVIEDDLGRCRNRNGEHETNAAPEPSPEKQRHRYRQRVELHPVS